MLYSARRSYIITLNINNLGVKMPSKGRGYKSYREKVEDGK